MFTGLVESTGVLARRAGRPVARVLIEAELQALVLGESIAVHGVCLTVDKIVGGGFEADLSAETREKTTLDALPIGARVHLERSTPLGGRMGGHIVLGHVDGLAEITGKTASGEALRVEFRGPNDLARFVAAKGAIAINGVSLTVNQVGRPTPSGFAFDVMLVPHTLGRTSLGGEAIGAKVNVEIDVLARYVVRQLELSGETKENDLGQRDQRILDKLRTGGFV